MTTFLLSGCNELYYRQESSSAPYPSELAFKSEELRQAFARSGTPKDIGWFQEETTFLHVFFKNEFIIQYKRDTLYGVNDFICKGAHFTGAEKFQTIFQTKRVKKNYISANMGGLMGLCLGFSLLSAIEVGPNFEPP